MSETTGIIKKSCCILKRLDGKLAIVTGASTGIGLVTAGELARRGAKVIMACRNLSKAKGAKKQLLEKYGVNNPESVNIDVACKDVTRSLSPIQNEQVSSVFKKTYSIKKFSSRIISKYTRLDFLINNAGLIVGKYEKTVDGFEMTMGVNHLGHFLLTELLLPLLKRSAPSRIIIVSSVVHYAARLNKPDLQLPEHEYSEVKAYNQSKLANVMHAVELSERLQNSGVTVVSVHPGVVKTEFGRDIKCTGMKVLITLTKPFYIGPWKGAQTTLYTVLSDKIVTGGYYSNCAFKEASSKVKNEKERKWLWDKSCELLGIQNRGS
ncbi:unnamed protein product [Trichobilharzia regenti]|nr:unnamed protein product [Trichobilharzia regenti]